MVNLTREDKPTAGEHNVIFQPIPNTSQSFAIDTRCHHTLYHGTRGPGKTITQLMRFRRFVGLGYGSYWRGVIFDREFKNLTDLVAQSKRFFSQFDDGARFYESPSEYKWTWPTGEVLYLRHVKKDDDYDSYHGHEYPFLGWNELTKFPTPVLYDKMMSTNRSSFLPAMHTPFDIDASGSKVYSTPDGLPLPPIPLQVFSTTNPNGPGHNWVRRRFINVADDGEVVRLTTMVFDPMLGKDREVTKTQVAIFGSYRENIYLSAEYIAELDRLTENNPNLRKAWLYGDWDFTAGGAFDDLWARDVHILPNFNIPQGWYVDRSFDWGSTHPFSTGWWAEANGEDVRMPDGTTWCPAAGSLIQIAEYYGCTEIGLNKGLRLGSNQIARKIKDNDDTLLAAGVVSTKVKAGPADNQISNITDSRNETIEKVMADEGVEWTTSDKSPGSRVVGLQLFRDRLRNAVTKEGPGIYFMARCIASIETIPCLPLDDKKIDDVDTTAEDHAWDMVRYRCLHGSNRIATSLKSTYAH